MLVAAKRPGFAVSVAVAGLLRRSTLTPAAILFTAVMALALLLAPRRWAPLPLLLASCYMTVGQVVAVGPFHFTVIRMLAAVGLIRVLLRRERPAGGMTGLDWVMIVWGLWALFNSAFHGQPKEAFINRLGLVYNTLGIYFLLRTFCQNMEDVIDLIKMTAIVLVPLGLAMVSEQFTHQNPFAVFGAVPEETVLRHDRFRSQGPFRHPILAGTVGAVCAPLMIGIWRIHPMMAKVGVAACLMMVVSSASSGPLMSLIFSLFALVLWRWRHFTRQIRIAGILGYLFLDLVMKAPAYYVIARIDLAGGSTGWHRARLIESAIEHLGEWVWAGTDYTRHWMPTGVSWSPDHTDITNHYLHMGVLGGLPLMVLFIGTLWLGFRYVGKALGTRVEAPFQDQFLVWTLGASLFAHVATCISVSYFDQSFLFLYLTLAMIVTVHVTERDSGEAALHGPL